MTRSKIHPLATCLLAGTFLGRLALFISLPYLAIYLTSNLGASPATAGLIIGVGPLCGVVCAFLMGFLSDKIGRRKILELSLVIWSIAFLGFAISTKLWHFAIFNMLYGASRSSFESVANALLSDVTDETNRKKVFHLRYFLINLAASFAPLIVAWLLIDHPQVGFSITSIIYFIYFIALHVSMSKWHSNIPFIKQDTLSIRGVMNVLHADKPLILFLFGTFLMLVGFSQIDATLPQYFTELYDKWGIKLFSYVMVTNGLTIVLFQYLINHISKNISVIKVIMIGFLIFSIGITSFAFFPDYPWMFIASMFIFSVGEILGLSNVYLLIDQLGPKHLKGSYFGVTELTGLGMAIGPWFGGVLLQYFGGPSMFIVMGFLSIISILLFQWGNRIYLLRPQVSKN